MAHAHLKTDGGVEVGTYPLGGDVAFDAAIAWNKSAEARGYSRTQIGTGAVPVECRCAQGDRNLVARLRAEYDAKYA